MTKVALKALKESISHWKRLANGKAADGESVGPENCALCVKFQLTHDTHCHKCPIRQKTGQAMCVETPYGKAHVAMEDYGLESRQFRTAAKAELKFLQ